MDILRRTARKSRKENTTNLKIRVIMNAQHIIEIIEEKLLRCLDI
jgi:hypothetical protein